MLHAVYLTAPPSSQQYSRGARSLEGNNDGIAGTGVMRTVLNISPEGVFEAGGRPHRIPTEFSPRYVLSYRVLTEPLQVIPRLKPLSANQMLKTRRNLLWRAAECLIPTFRGTDPRLMTLSQLDSLHDWIVRHHIRRYAESDVQPRYLVMSYWKAKPGKDEQMTAIFKRSVAPVFDRLLEEGTLLGYGITTQELHTDPSWSHVSWTSINDLSAMDAVDEALMNSLNEVDMAAFVSASDWSAHHDQIMMIVHLGGTPPQE